MNDGQEKPAASDKDAPTGKRIVVAETAGAHGVRGAMKLRIFAEDPALVAHKDGVFLSEDPTDMRRVFLTLKNAHKDGMWLVSMQGVTSPEAIKAMGRTRFYLDRDSLPALQDGVDEFYYHDLEGLRVFMDDNGAKGEEIGQVLSVRNYGGGDLLYIRRRNGEEFYHVFSAATVPVVDVKGGFVTIIELEIL